MKKTLALLAASLLATLACAPRASRNADVSVDVFYDSLQPYGDWIQTADYGYVWHPRDAAPEWRPYSKGSWAYTDAGWTWVSEEPFGWSRTYHYGRWAQTDEAGWVWVPGETWAPAWVSWRSSEQIRRMGRPCRQRPQFRSIGWHTGLGGLLLRYRPGGL